MNCGTNESGVVQMKPIAKISCDFPDKFGIPRQSGLVDELEATIIFEPEYRDPNSLRGIEDWSHLWLIWQFSRNLRDGWSPTVRPPRLGGNRRVGVFATRSPFRPNPLGLSCVKLLQVVDTENHGRVLIVSGADLMDGTPIYDIKPYLRYTDSRPDASGGFADEVFDRSLDVSFPPELLAKLPENRQNAVVEILSMDPRPAVQDDPMRIYGMRFAGYEIKFTVDGRCLRVVSVDKEI
mgnify:FL=1